MECFSMKVYPTLVWRTRAFFANLWSVLCWTLNSCKYNHNGQKTQKTTGLSEKGPYRMAMDSAVSVKLTGSFFNMIRSIEKYFLHNGPKKNFSRRYTLIQNETVSFRKSKTQTSPNDISFCSMLKYEPFYIVWCNSYAFFKL